MGISRMYNMVSGVNTLVQGSNVIGSADMNPRHRRAKVRNAASHTYFQQADETPTPYEAARMQVTCHTFLIVVRQ